MTPPRSEYGNAAWRARARCREAPTSLFFPDSDEDAEPARAICRGCCVQAACASYALADPELVGVWGGLGEAERRLIRSTSGELPRANAASSLEVSRTSPEHLDSSPARRARLRVTAEGDRR